MNTLATQPISTPGSTALSSPQTLTAKMPDLDALLHAQTIAVVGASSDPRKIGGRPIAYMLANGFAGKVFPINPTQTTIQGLPAYPSLAAIGHPVDQVIVAVAGSKVKEVVLDAIAQSARCIIIFSSGFGEIDEAGKQAQEDIAQLCAQAGVLLLGPNCIGVFNARRAMYSTFMTALEHGILPAGNVAIVTQSGAIGSYLYGLAGDRGVRFSHFLATGNEAGMDVADAIAWLANDPDTRVIMVYLEGCRDGRRLRQALLAARANRKVIVALKVGASEQGAAAAASHTGSLAGSDAIYDAVLSECNAWRVSTLEEMADMAYACSISALPKGNRLGVITPSGGVGVIAADTASGCGLTLPELPMPLQQQIKEIVPFSSATNPVDTTAQTLGDRTLFNRIMRVLFSYEGFDSILSFNANLGQSDAEFDKIKDELFALRRANPELLVAVCTRAIPSVVKQLEENGIIYFSDPARATNTIGALAQLAAGFAAGQPQAVSRKQPALTLPTGPITEYIARDLLAQHGIPFVPQAIAQTGEEAVQASARLGFPLAMKVLSPDILHKSDVGGVRLNLADAESVMDAWTAIMASVAQNCPGAAIEGVLLSPMVAGGVEMVLGVTRDPVFGPVVMFGLGGVFVEVFKDVTFRPAPLSSHDAMHMIRQVRALPLLEGARGSDPVDLECVAQALVALSEFAVACGDELESVEINPFIGLKSGGYAVDALIVKRADAAQTGGH
ncbi:MAG TPA: acetate--CoA ligase family protein [Eoetvoesiella sp.]